MLEVPVLVFAFVIQSVVHQGKCHASFVAATVGTQDRIKKITEGTIKKIIRVKFCQVLRVNVCKNQTKSEKSRPRSKIDFAPFLCAVSLSSVMK